MVATRWVGSGIALHGEFGRTAANPGFLGFG
jgi:hypothetical protein